MKSIKLSIPLILFSVTAFSQTPTPTFIAIPGAPSTPTPGALKRAVAHYPNIGPDMKMPLRTNDTLWVPGNLKIDGDITEFGFPDNWNISIIDPGGAGDYTTVNSWSNSVVGTKSNSEVGMLIPGENDMGANGGTVTLRSYEFLTGWAGQETIMGASDPFLVRGNYSGFQNMKIKAKDPMSQVIQLMDLTGATGDDPLILSNLVVSSTYQWEELGSGGIVTMILGNSLSGGARNVWMNNVRIYSKSTAYWEGHPSVDNPGTIRNVTAEWSIFETVNNTGGPSDECKAVAIEAAGEFVFRNCYFKNDQVNATHNRNMASFIINGLNMDPGDTNTFNFYDCTFEMLAKEGSGVEYNMLVKGASSTVNLYGCQFIQNAAVDTVITDNAGGSVINIYNCTGVESFSGANVTFFDDGIFTGGLSAEDGNPKNQVKVEADGDVVIDTNTLFVANADNRVGIGTITPSTRLNIIGVGSGDETLLRIQKGASWSGDGDDLAYGFDSFGGTLLSRIALERVTGGAGQDYSLNFYNTSDAGASVLNRMTIDHNGNIGVGDTTPDDRFEVSGSAISLRLTDTAASVGTKIKFTGNDTLDGSLHMVVASNILEFEDSAGTAQATIDHDNGNFTTNGSIVVGSPTGGDKGAGTINAVAVYDDDVLLTDFVFESAYDLPTIEKERDFINRHGGLSSMPRASEFSGGQRPSVGSLVTRLWETVERQHLYIEQLNERIKELEEKLP
jgi:hypothetical protein